MSESLAANAEPSRVTLPDGSHLAVQVHGSADAPIVLLIAGVAADHTTWGTYPDDLATLGVLTGDVD